MKGRIGLGVFIGIGLLVAFSLAFFVSPQASSKPDGLNKVAIDKGFSDQEEAHGLEDVPTAGYAVEGVDNDRLSTGLAGLIGVTVTFAIAAGLFVVVKRTGRAGSDRQPTSVS
jgi:hypothetical protein